MAGDIELAEQALTDLDVGSSDLLRLTATAYNNVQRDRLEAWLQATSIPDSLKKELSKMELAKPSDSKDLSSLLDQKASDQLEKFVESRKDEGMRKLALSSFKRGSSKPSA